MNHENLGHRFSTPALQVRRSQPPSSRPAAAKAASGAGPAFSLPGHDRRSRTFEPRVTFYDARTVPKSQQSGLLFAMQVAKTRLSPVLPLNRVRIPHGLPALQKLFVFYQRVNGEMNSRIALCIRSLYRKLQNGAFVTKCNTFLRDL
jgi:hypothetical protein